MEKLTLSAPSFCPIVKNLAEMSRYFFPQLLTDTRLQLLARAQGSIPQGVERKPFGLCKLLVHFDLLAAAVAVIGLNQTPPLRLHLSEALLECIFEDFCLRFLCAGRLHRSPMPAYLRHLQLPAGLFLQEMPGDAQREGRDVVHAFVGVRYSGSFC